MTMFEGLLGNLDEVAAKLGVPSDTLHALAQSVQSRMASGGDLLASVTHAAQEHGISLESLQGLMSKDGAQDMISKVTSALDKDGDGNPLNDLSGFAKGLFGKD